MLSTLVNFFQQDFSLIFLWVLLKRHEKGRVISLWNQAKIFRDFNAWDKSFLNDTQTFSVLFSPYFWPFIHYQGSHTLNRWGRVSLQVKQFTSDLLIDSEFSTFFHSKIHIQMCCNNANVNNSEWWKIMKFFVFFLSIELRRRRHQRDKCGKIEKRF